MPLPSDEKLIALSEKVLAQFELMFGLHPGFRPAHAHGVLLSGTFTPAREATALTRAPHIARESTPVLVRFSNSTGLPQLPDTDPNASPRGLAIRFQLAEHVHTDIISHSADGFPTRTADEFLELLQAVTASGDPSKPPPSPLDQFLSRHPETVAYLQTPKPNPASFATESYFGVTASQFTNEAGASKFGRYRIVPDAGNAHLDEAASKTKGPTYLFDELNERIAKGSIGFHIRVQVADEGDVVDNATIHWPEDRAQVEFGKINLTAIVPDNESEQKHIIFDPIPRVEGIEPSADPLLELRAAIYLISGRRRRKA